MDTKFEAPGDWGLKLFWQTPKSSPAGYDIVGSLCSLPGFSLLPRIRALCSFLDYTLVHFLFTLIVLLENNLMGFSFAASMLQGSLFSY